MRIGMRLTVVPPLRPYSFEEIKMIKRNNAQRPGPHGMAIASQYIYFPCVMSGQTCWAWKFGQSYQF